MANPIPAVVQSEGTGGLQKVTLTHSCGSSAEIYLWGATLTSYKSKSGHERIFVSPGAIFDGKKAIRGGVPLVFPQFGQPDPAMAQHGFARSSFWRVASIGDDGSKVSASFALSDSPATKEKWPHSFKLTYIVTLEDDVLDMRLRVENAGDSPFSYQALLHTYFKIPDIGTAAVAGLSGRKYVDKVAGGETKDEDQEKIVLPSFTDRIYIGQGAGLVKVSVADAEGDLYAIENGASVGEAVPVDVVVWNPYEAASPGDLPPPAFKEFVCVEPGLVSKSFGLPPGQVAEVSQTIRALR